MTIRLAAILVLALPRPVASQAPSAPAPPPPLRVQAALDVPTVSGAARAVLLAEDGEEPSEARLEIALPGTPSRVQAIDVSPEVPFDAGTLRSTDLDEDAHPELLVRAWRGMSNQGFRAWRFDAASGMFVEIDRFEDISHPQVDPGTGCIDGYAVGGAAGGESCSQRFCWHERKLVQVRSQCDVHEGEILMRVTHELREGQLVETERRVLTDDESAGEP